MIAKANVQKKRKDHDEGHTGGKDAEKMGVRR